MAKPEKAGSDSVVTLIKVIRPFKNYSPGDNTGFDAAKAQALIDGGVAEAYTAAEGEE